MVGKPLIERYKHARFLSRYALITRQRALSGDVPGIIAKVRGRNVLVTIAFNDPSKISIQLRAVRKFVPDCIHLIADNSRDDRLAVSIAQFAAEQDAFYVRVPRGPWTGLNGGLSHGLGMTWVWRNILRPAQPHAFGFLDHDIYPTKPTDPFAPLRFYPIAGRVWMRPPRWHLWAGFCFFRYDFCRTTRMNFIRDWFAGLDTGGGNWRSIFRHLDPARVSDPGVLRSAILKDVDVDTCAVEWIGNWLHEHNDWRHLDGPQTRDYMAEKSIVVTKWMEDILQDR